MYYIYNFLATVLFIFVILPYFTWRYFREKAFPAGSVRAWGSSGMKKSQPLPIKTASGSTVLP